MSKQYREVAAKLGVRYLFGRYGFQAAPKDPSGKRYQLFSIVRLDGWTFDPHEIIEAIANDPDMSIKYGEKE